jgi:hypothetical protein
MSDVLQPDELRRPAARQAMKLPIPVRVHAPGRRGEIASTKDALGFIDRQLPSELARLPRWTFAHALLLEAERTGKSRDLKAAARQFRQALSNEKWLDEEKAEEKNP